MDPVIGHIIVIAAVSVLAFFCLRSMLNGIRAEMRGERSCAGCSGCGTGAGCKECRLCVERLEKLKAQKKQ